MSHTKGPWEIAFILGKRQIHAPMKRSIVLLREEARDAEDLANEALILAAPEMLEALKAAVDALRDYMNATGFKKIEIEQCEAVIKKATCG